jgi:hypothetical protein
MHAQTLLTALHQQGFTLTPLPGNKLEIRPASRLTPELREQLRQRKAELLPLLAAMAWLRSRLALGPQQIADLFSEWCADVVGRPSPEISARMDLLNDARWALEVEAFIGEDERFWWRLPQQTRQ